MTNHNGIQEALTGIFLLVIIAVLAFFTIVISGVDLLRGHKQVVRHARFESIGSLRVQDPVLVRGMTVGNIQALKLASGAIDVTFHLNSDVQIHEDYKVSIAQTTLLGGGCMELAEGSQGDLVPEDAVLQGTTPVNLMQNISGLVDELRASINPTDIRETLANIKQVSADLSVIVTRVEKGEGLVGKLLSSDETLYNDIRDSVSNIKTITNDINSGKGLLGKLINSEDAAYEDLQVTLANLKGISEDLHQGKGTLGKLISTEDTTYEDLKAAIANIKSITAKLDTPNSGFSLLLGENAPIMQDLQVTATHLKSVTAKLDSGEGTLGKLIADDTVSTELESTIKDVRQIIDNMRDTAPITTFTSLFFSGL